MYGTDIDYTPPATLADIDDEAIHARMLANLPRDIDTTTGGFAHEFTRPASILAADIMIDINEAIQIFFPRWSYGIWLDRHAESDGLTRRAACAAVGNLTITGVAGTTIKAGSLFATPSVTEDDENIEFAVLEDVTIGEDGTAVATVECTQTGTIGNVPSDSITLMSSPISGVESVTNQDDFTGGTEEESDDDLRERIALIDQQSEAMGVGSVADYTRWALEVSGVGGVIVLPEWAGKGTGTVKLLLSGTDGQPAGEDICAAVYAHIMGTDDDPLLRKAPIGAILTVDSITTLSLTISATITISDSSVQSVESEFAKLIKSYFAIAAEEGIVRYTRVGALLTETPGVTDYENLLLNGSTGNINLASGQMPVATISFAEDTNG